MKKIIKTGVLLFLLLIPLISYAKSISPIEIENTVITNQKQIINNGEIDGVRYSYSIGSSNTISTNNGFQGISINFDKNFSGSLEVYRKQNYYQEREDILFQTFDISGRNFKSYVYTQNQYLYSFYLVSGNIKRHLDLNSNYGYEGIKELIDEKDISLTHKYHVLTKVTDILDLDSIRELHLKKENLSESEFKLILEFIYRGGKLVVYDDKLVNIIENNKLEKIELDKGIYEYIFGFGKITNDLSGSYYAGTRHLGINTIEQLLFDDGIKSKYVPFYLVLIITIVYFIVSIPVNLWMAKRKKNKFFLFYSIPIISVSFFILLALINISYKGFSDIENKLEINYHMDGKIYKEVTILTFSPYGGDYDISINSNDYQKTNYYSNGEQFLRYDEGKIQKIIKNIKPSQTFTYSYSKLIKEFHNEPEFDKEYSSLDDLLGNATINNSSTTFNNSSTRSYDGYYVDINSEIEKIGLREDDNSYMNKYTFGGEKNYDLILDIYFK